MSIESYPNPNGVLTSLIWRKTATGGETSLSGYDNASQALSYTPGQEQVYLNGILLVRGSDYTATNGTSITNLVALAADDFVQINCYNNFSVASVPGSSITGEIPSVQTQLDAKIPKTLTTTTGDIIYASSANTPARLGIGSTNQVLTVSGGIPTWSTAAGGDIVKITNGSFSSTSSLSINDCFSSNYKNYKLIINWTCSAGEYLLARMRASGSDATGTDYDFIRLYAQSSSPGSSIDQNFSSVAIGAGNTNPCATEVMIYNPYMATRTQFQANSVYDGFKLDIFTGQHRQDISYTGINIRPASGTITGTYSIYGINP